MIAHNIENTTGDAVEASDKADAAADAVFQVWEGEATIYVFSDRSVLAVSGPCVDAYDNAAAAAEDFPGADF